MSSDTVHPCITSNLHDFTSINSAVYEQNVKLTAQFAVSKKPSTYTHGVLIEVHPEVVVDTTHERITKKHNKWTAANYLWLIKSYQQSGEYKTAAEILGKHK